MEESLKWTAPNSSVVYSSTALDRRIGGAGATVHISSFEGVIAVTIGFPKGYSLAGSEMQGLANSVKLPIHVFYPGGGDVFNPN